MFVTINSFVTICNYQKVFVTINGFVTIVCLFVSVERKDSIDGRVNRLSITRANRAEGEETSPRSNGKSILAQGFWSLFS